MQNRRLITVLWLAPAMLMLTASYALAATPTAPIESCPPPHGVLTNCPQPTFGLYIRAVLKDDMGYIITAALLMIIASGVQYMLSGIGSADGQKQARQRILGIISGVVLLILIDLILNQLATGLTAF